MIHEHTSYPVILGRTPNWTARIRHTSRTSIFIGDSVSGNLKHFCKGSTSSSTFQALYCKALSTQYYPLAQKEVIVRQVIQMFGEFFIHKRNQTTIPCQINQMIQSLHGYAWVMFWRIMEYHGIPISKYLNTLNITANNNGKTPFKQSSATTQSLLVSTQSLAMERQALAAWNVNKIRRTSRPMFSPLFFETEDLEISVIFGAHWNQEYLSIGDPSVFRIITNFWRVRMNKYEMNIISTPIRDTNCFSFEFHFHLNTNPKTRRVE